MKPNPIARATAFAFALLMTAGMLGAIDHLAGLEEASPQWAAGVMAKRAA